MKRLFNPSLFALFHDVAMAGLSFLLALYLRLGDDWLELSAHYATAGTIIFVGVCVLVFTYMRLYRGMWHFASMEDLLAIGRAVTLAILVFAFLMFTISRLDGFPRSALLINWLLLMFMLGAPRFAYRLWKDRGFKFALKSENPSIPVILYGSGNNAELFVRDSLRKHESVYRVVAIIDNNPNRSNRTLHGIKIYDAALPFVIRKLERYNVKAQRLVIAEDVEVNVMKRLVADADEHGLTLSRLPRIDQLQKQQATGNINQSLKPIDIEDLLGRPQAARDKTMMHRYVKNKCVLVTGAGGSIGSELCRQLAGLEPDSLMLLDSSETALYHIDQEIRRRFPNLKTHAVLADVRHYSAIRSCFENHKIDIIFHAAAIKHVPLSEDNPVAAIHTNVVGTHNMMQAAEEFGTGAMVLISTDKAVNPTNVMGATKRLAETVFLSEKANGASHVTVRFGNVLGSAGSVVPLFQQQLKRGGPLTVTHKDMTRYFMTIREAVDLVIHAAALADDTKQKRALYVLDMGEPVSITTLAEQMVRLSGLRPHEDIEITYTGLRPGEKLYEELFYAAESPKQTEVTGIMQSNQLPLAPEDFSLQISQLKEACQNHLSEPAISSLTTLVPEYKR